MEYRVAGRLRLAFCPLAGHNFQSVLRIERQCFDVPWTEKDFVEGLRHRDSYGEVVLPDDKVRAFGVVHLRKNHWMYISNLAVERAWRREGIGRTILERFQEQALQRSAKWMVALVRETNLAAQLFFQHCGFKACFVVDDPYEGLDEKAYCMVRGLGLFDAQDLSENALLRILRTVFCRDGRTEWSLRDLRKQTV